MARPGAALPHPAGSARGDDAARVRRGLEWHPPVSRPHPKPLVAFAGAIAWPVLCGCPVQQKEATPAWGSAPRWSPPHLRIAFELWRERRKSLFSRTAGVVVPSLHAAIFLMPLAMQAFMPEVAARGSPSSPSRR